MIEEAVAERRRGGSEDRKYDIISIHDKKSAIQLVSEGSETRKKPPLRRAISKVLKGLPSFMGGVEKFRRAQNGNVL